METRLITGSTGGTEVFEGVESKRLCLLNDDKSQVGLDEDNVCVVNANITLRRRRERKKWRRKRTREREREEEEEEEEEEDEEEEEERVRQTHQVDMRQ